MRTNRLLPFVVLSIWCGVLYAQNGDQKNVLLTLDKEPTYVDEFIYLYKKNHQGKPEEFTQAKIDEYFDLFVNFKLKVMEAEKRGMANSEAFRKELNQYKEELRKPYIAEPDLLDNLVREAYARLSDEVKASHILIALKQDPTPEDTLSAYKKAEEVKSKIRGDANFAELASQISDDPSAKSNGGSLGYFTAMQMVYPFEQAAFQSKVGEVVGPVRTRFGYHLIKVEDRRPSKGEVEVSHILVRGEDDRARKSIYEAYGKLTSGVEWTQVCKDYSQDPGTKDNGGRLRPFGSGALASAPKFEEVAFSLNEPGSISAPFQSPYGWHIIRMEKKIPLPAFEDLEASLKRRVGRDERLIISKSKLNERRKKQLQYVEVDSLHSILNHFADSSLVNGKWAIDKLALRDSPLFQLVNRTYTTSDFGRYVVANQRPTQAVPKEYVGLLFDSFVEGCLAEAEDERLQQSTPEYRNLVNEYREGILLFNIMEGEVWNKASEDSVGQHQYYLQHSEKYKAGNRVSARIFSAARPALRDSILAKIQQGDSLTITDLRKLKTTGQFRNYEKGEHPAVDQVSWAIGLHKADADGMYYLVEINTLVPPGVKKFSETRAAVISDYQDYLEQIWIDQLKSKYQIKVNKKNKKKAFAELLAGTRE